MRSGPASSACCLATSGPGGIHLLNGLYDAKLDGAPVLAITGLQFHDLIHTYTQQDVELDKLFIDVAVYNARVMGPAHTANVTELACRTALAYRGVAHVTMPVDMQSMPCTADARSERNIPNHVSKVMARAGTFRTRRACSEAAAVLNAGSKITILAGRGALGAARELAADRRPARCAGGQAAARQGGAGGRPCALASAGSGCSAPAPAQDALEGCDTLLIVGSSFPYIEFYPKPGKARAVQIELDPKRIGLRYPVEAPLVGDSRTVLRLLMPMLERKEDRSFLEGAQADMTEWRAMMHERGTRTDMPMKPQVVAHELNKLLRDDAIVVTDSGTITTWAARHVDMRGDMKFSCSGNLATMACGLPYAMAAAVAYPSRQVVAFVGDGGLTMLMGELATCVKYKLDVKIIVIKNNSLGQIKWEQMVFLGNPEFGCDLQPIDFVGIARGLRRPGLCRRRAGRVRRRAEKGAGDARAGADRGHGRPQRAADAAEGDPASGGPSGREPGSRNARRWPHRPDDRRRRDPRAGMSRAAQTVVITGASAGVGRATARKFAARGARLGLIARGTEGLTKAAEEARGLGGSALAIPADVADADAVEAAAAAVEDRFGPIDVWVNVAMATVFAPVADLTAEEFRRATEVTYLGCVHGTLAALRRMRPRNRGTIVQVGSALAYRAIPLQAPYCAAKFAIRGFTDSLRCELLHDKCDVHLTMVQMPALNTPQFTWARNKTGRRPQPVPPIFQPEVAARAIVFAANARRREVWVGWPSVKAIVAQRLIPGWLDRYLAKYGYESQMSSEPADPSAPDNLFAPLPGDFGAHGRFDKEASYLCSQLPLTRHRGAVGLAALALGLGTAVLIGRRGR